MEYDCPINRRMRRVFSGALRARPGSEEVRRRYQRLRGDLTEFIWGTRKTGGRGRTLDGILWKEGTSGSNPSLQAMDTGTSLDTTRRWILHVARGAECCRIPDEVATHPRYRKIRQELAEREPEFARLEVGLGEELEEAEQDGEQKRSVAPAYAEKILALERKICPDDFVRWVMGKILPLASSTFRDRQYGELRKVRLREVGARDFIGEALTHLEEGTAARTVSEQPHSPEGSAQPLEVQIHPRPKRGTPRIFLDLDELRRRHPEVAARLDAGASLPFEVVHHHGKDVDGPHPAEDA